MSSTANGFDQPPTLSSYNAPRGPSSTWSRGSSENGGTDPRGGRGSFGGGRPRGRGGFRRRRRGGRFCSGGERKGPWNSRADQALRDPRDLKPAVPGADLRGNLEHFYDLERNQEFQPLLKESEGADKAVETEVRDFLRTKLTNPDHARYITAADFAQLGLSSDAICQLNLTPASSGIVELPDMVAARRLSGTISLQLEEWERYFAVVKELHSLQVFDAGPVVATVESEATLNVIDEMLAELDRMTTAAASVTETCRMKRKEIFQSAAGKISEKPKGLLVKAARTAEKTAVVMGLLAAVFGLSAWYTCRFRS
ncbi:hypothetical protein BV898_11502 [Hypsibius exemplaris]|uniref:Uncharacterized protein n=1 Tax=Hypsibius exemplaris TaxID=2072580 RepID=A0A1W0WGE0_HYPEX|nr:hypothetical protein BV898_11502 [Hypsibius exemplaris]